MSGSPTWRDPVILALALSGALVSGWLGLRWFGGQPFDQDSTAHVFQARLFAHGLLALPAPPSPGLSSSCHVNIQNGRWYGKYPPGNALALAAGEALGVPWLVPPLLTGALLYLLGMLVGTWHGLRAARLVTALALLSPAVIVVGASPFSENASRVFLALALLGAARGARPGPGAGARIGWPALAGTGLGLAAMTRPLTALAFCPALALIAWRGLRDGASPRRALVAGAPLAVLVALQLSYNAVQTGHPLQFTFNAVQVHDRLGFGRHATGHELPAELQPFTAAHALERVGRHVLPCSAHNLLGWGEYRHQAHLPQHGATEKVVAGLVARGLDGAGRLTLQVWGMQDGFAHVQLRTPGREGLRGEIGPLDAGARLDVGLRLQRAPDGRWRAFARPAGAAGVGEWLPVGEPVEVPALRGPVELGLHAAVPGAEGRLLATFDEVRVDGAPARLDGPAWRWAGRPRPARWQRAGARLELTADVDQRLPEGTAPALVRSATSRAPALEARLRADWRAAPPAPAGPRTWLLLVVPLLVALPLAGVAPGGRHLGDVVGAATFAGCLVAYFFYHYEGSEWGGSPLGSRYYNEAMVLGLLPLVGRAMLGLWDRMRRRWARALLLAALALLSIDTARAYARADIELPRWSEMYQDLPHLVREHVRERGLEDTRLVVYLPFTEQAPLGEYPFAPLERTRVLYYKLGPAPLWGLPGEDWRAAHRRWPERRPLIYREHQLIELSR